ncbi:MAG: glutamate-5-semialdehyde dehydrogenase [bacterium]
MNPDLMTLARDARAASRSLAQAEPDTRSRILREIAAELSASREALLAANALDLQEADRTGLKPALRDRLVLTSKKLSTLVDGARQLAATADPLGRRLSATLLDDGLELEKVTSPLGVVLVIFESRPDVVVQIALLTLRSGNAVIMKGGSEALHSNRALVGCLRAAIDRCGVSPEVVCQVERREEIAALLELDELIDLVIPRGSGELVRSIQAATRIPVLGHAEGVCHVYFDAAANLSRAARIAVDAKCDYPAACNAAETFLVHTDLLARFQPVVDALLAQGVEIRADEPAARALSGTRPAAPEDFGAEFGDLVVALKTVSDIDEAVAHIHRYGSGHTEAVVTEDTGVAERFLRTVDASSVFHNASTRFADGYRYGLGAEVGISTSRIHARGPVGVDGLLTTRWLLRGAGQVVSDYGPDGRSYLHQPML